MFKFEGASITKKEKNKKSEEKTILQSIRDNPKTNMGLNAFILSSTFTAVYPPMEKTRENINKNRIELSQEKERALSYEIKENQFVGDTIKYLSDESISDMVIKIKDANILDLFIYNNDLDKEIIETENKIKNPNHINKEIENNKKHGYIVEDTLSFQKEVNSYLSKKLNKMKEKVKENSLIIEEKKSIVSEDDKEEMRLKIIEIISLVEQAKLDVIKHIGSYEYLEKLAEEMDISKKSAKAHVKVRINNIKNISYDLKNSEEISFDTEGTGYAYYSSGTNKIALPYNINLEDAKEKEKFCESVTHEILHESTMANDGLSGTVEEYMRDSFSPVEDEDREDSIYFSDPAELIVRKQILDLNMEKNGIKKYGDEFKEEHYKKLLKLKEEGKLTPNENQLIDHIKKPEDFVNMMNGLAENKNEAKGDYHNPEWNYGDENNKA